MVHHFPHRIALSVIAIAASVVVAGCAASTTLESGWTSPNVHNQPQLTRVVTVFISNSETIRRTAEDQLARDLAARGVQATPGYALLTDAEGMALATIAKPQNGDVSGVTAKLRDMGYDGVVTMRIVDREQQVDVSPGYGGGWGYPGWGYPGDWGYWPGYSYVYTTYRIDTAAYSLRTNHLMWSGLIKTVNPDGTHQLISDATRMVTKQLSKQGLAG